MHKFNDVQISMHQFVYDKVIVTMHVLKQTSHFHVLKT